MSQLRMIANMLLSKHDRVKVLLIGMSTATIFQVLCRILYRLRDVAYLKNIIIKFIIRVLRMIPGVHAQIQKQKRNAIQSIEASIHLETESASIDLPKNGTALNEVVKVLQSKSKSEKERWSKGNLTGAVYNTSADLAELHSFALSNFSKANLLHPDIFIHTRQMEAELIRMVLDLFAGDKKDACGSVTSGGTESILLAVKAYRDRARKERGIRFPNMVVPSTAHAAFAKASEYFGVELRRSECDESRNFEVDLGHMHSLIDSNTILLVGSAPQFPHGTVDPIPAIAKMAKKRNIGCHVDACLGSLLLPFMQKTLWYKANFSVDGVTSISCDTHKYGYAPKGTSVLMYRSASLRAHQYSVCSDWEGGLYATPTIAGSRCSGPVVGAWASMMFMGKSGYAACAQKIQAATRRISQHIEESAKNDLRLLGRPDTSVVSFTTKDDSKLNIFDLAEWMKQSTAKKWTLAILQKPAGVHFAVTMANVDNVEEFCADLSAGVAAEKKRIASGGKLGSSDSAAIYGSAASVPKSIVDELVIAYLDTCYQTGR